MFLIVSASLGQRIIKRNDLQIKHGSNLLKQDDNFLTPLTAAIFHRHATHVNLILDSFQDRAQLLSYVNLPAKSYTPLMIAALKPVYSIVLRLLEAGADPNVRFR